MTMERPITFRPEDRQTRTTEPFAIDPVATIAETQRWHPTSVTSFADAVTPRRRDPYFGNAIAESPAMGRALDPDASSFSAGTWAMIVFAGMLLGVATTLLLAGA